MSGTCSYCKRRFCLDCVPFLVINIFRADPKNWILQGGGVFMHIININIFDLVSRLRFYEFCKDRF